jgi:hypothetical protein
MEKIKNNKIYIIYTKLDLNKKYICYGYKIYVYKWIKYNRY